MEILVFDFPQFFYKNYRKVQKLPNARKVLISTLFLTFETQPQIWAVVATTTIAVVESRTETAEVAAETFDRGGEPSDHRAGKEIIEDVPPSSRQEAADIELEEEEHFNFGLDSFSPASPVGSSALRFRDRVPQPPERRMILRLPPLLFLHPLKK